jgi:hypothetical protein
MSKGNPVWVDRTKGIDKGRQGAKGQNLIAFLGLNRLRSITVGAWREGGATSFYFQCQSHPPSSTIHVEACTSWLAYDKSCMLFSQNDHLTE